MALRDSGRRRPLLLSAGVLAAVVGVLLGIWRPWVPAADVPLVAAGENSIPTAPLSLPDAPRVLVFGDSWTYGSAATEPTLGYAYLLAERLGGTTIVDGVRGSGYLKPGIDGPDYGERIAALDPGLELDLIVIQGSINDRRLPATGYRSAVGSAWDSLSTAYPGVPIVVLGPAPQVLPVEPATARIDADLQALAAARGWWYLSPIQDAWITSENYAEVIDSGAGRDHPSDAGHRYLADRLAAAIRGLATASVVASDETDADPVK